MKARKLRLFVADDHPLIRHGVRALLQAHKGWSLVGEAADGNDAARQIEAIQPDVAIIDITMPGMDGLQLTHRLHRTAPRVKIVVLTIHESAQLVRLVLDAGASGFVLKSDAARNLIDAIKLAAAGDVFLSSRVSEILLRASLPSQGSDVQPRKSPTARQLEIVRLLASGKSHKEIACALDIATSTVETHRGRIMLKLGLRSFEQLVKYAKIRGLLTPPPAQAASGTPRTEPPT